MDQGQYETALINIEPVEEAAAEPAPAPTWTYRPEPGAVVLFPSYLYHRTIPFRSDQQRISIAFDVLTIPQG